MFPVTRFGVDACPFDSELARFVEGALPPSDVARVELHVDACPACRGLLADVALARSTAVPTTAAEPHPGETVPRGSLDPGRRYRVLELVGQGGMGRVYRAVDRLTGRAVALKCVRLLPSLPAKGRAPGAFPTPLTALEQEFRVLSTLRHPNVIAVLDYGFDRERQPFFSMELLEGASPLLPLAPSAPLAAQIDLLLQLLRALRYLHRRGVLHRDLKPSNILVTRGGALKVVDFGLAAGSEEAPRARAAGTLPYMAPELFRGGMPSEASDLHAFGVVAYEVLTGRHPFGPARTASEQIARILDDSPDLAPIPEALRPAVGWALAKAPGERPKDAAALLRILSAASGAASDEPDAARESFLVAARFTGRGEELGRLREALAAAVAGRGSAFRVCGDSGVGKSRLLDELRSRALVDGVLVVRGQALPSGGPAFHVWHRVLSVLALHVDLSPLEASVLGVVLPHLGALIEREVPAPPPEPDVQSTQLRLLRVLREVILRTREPLLILLEDLHWADEESLSLAAQVGADLEGLPVLLVASHRGDEAPRLPARLPALRPLALGRFDRGGVEQLCASMLGPDETSAELVDLVARETEGNAFFVVEVLRALAEERRDLGDGALPARVLAGGVEQVFARRLSRVPPEAAGLLRLSAVAGRELDLDVLSKHAPGAEALARGCADAGVLEVHEQGFRFSHDKLRERVIAALGASERRELHAQIADALEATYPGSAAHAASIAHHHREAGHAAQAARFYALAGETALAHGAPAEAEAMLKQARALHPSVDLPVLDRVRVSRGLAQAHHARGQLQDADAALRRVFALAGSPLPDGGLALAVACGRQMAEHVARSSGLGLGVTRGPRSEDERALRAELHLALTASEVYVWLSQPGILALCTLWGLNLEDALGARDRTSFGAAAAFMLAHTPLAGLAPRYLERAAATAAGGTQGESEHLRIQAMIHVAQGRWKEAASAAEAAVSVARASRDDSGLLRCLLPLQLAESELDDYPRSLATCVEMERLAARVDNAPFLAVALLGQVFAAFRLGELAEAEAALERATRPAPGDLGPLLHAIAAGLSALCAVEQGQAERAAALSSDAIKAVRRAGPSAAQTRYPIACALEAYLSAERPERYAAEIRWALRELHRIARRFSFGEPNAWLMDGRCAWRLDGDHARAAASLRRSLRSAERLGSRYGAAEAHYWLGRIARGRAEGASHLRAAASGFDRLGCARAVERALTALSVS